MRRLDRTGWIAGEDTRLVALRAVAESHPARILEVGSGTGDFALMLAAPEVVCVDRSAAAVEAARTKGLTARIADVRELPFADGSFDVVVANWMPCHVPDRARAIAEMARVLRVRGRFVGCYTAPDHLRELWSSVGVAGTPTTLMVGTAPTSSVARSEPPRREAPTARCCGSRQRLQTYLDAYREMYGPLTAPDGPYPFRARRRNVVFVATR